MLLLFGKHTRQNLQFGGRRAAEYGREGRALVGVLYERCGALDVHKKVVVACVVTPKGKETKAFGTMTNDLLELADYLVSKGCTHMAMESTGVYWKPIYNILEGLGMEVLVVNARDIKAVPDRKRDVKDAEWICDLLRHGLLRGRFIPDRPQRELRELVRYRKDLIRKRAREVNRIQKVLEGANIKLGDVATDVMGKSGQAILEALVAGETDPETLTQLAMSRLKKTGQLTKATEGFIGPRQRIMLAVQIKHARFLNGQIKKLGKEIEERMRPFEKAVEVLDGTPGIGRQTTEEALAKTGDNMSRFRSAARLASWAGPCPANNESAGKRKSGCTGPGNLCLRTTLVGAGCRAAHAKSTYLSARDHRIAAHRGGGQAGVALAHTILVITYHMLKNGAAYQDLGGATSTS